MTFKHIFYVGFIEDDQDIALLRRLYVLDLYDLDGYISWVQNTYVHHDTYAGNRKFGFYEVVYAVADPANVRIYCMVREFCVRCFQNKY